MTITTSSAIYGFPGAAAALEAVRYGRPGCR